MNRTLASGLVLTALGVGGYLVGVAGDESIGFVEPYPGRAFSVTGLMVGITLLAIGAGYRWRGDQR